mgnify:CR=1 FL=1|tara:strand:+ start:101 stop:286 length:186 start_codon:yes stop_codon:yes gene_type:complete
MNVNNGTYYTYYQDKRNYAPIQTVRKKPVEKKLDLLEEVTILANSIKDRLAKIDTLIVSAK